MIELLTYLNAVIEVAQRTLRGKRNSEYILNRIRGEKIWIKNEKDALEDIYQNMESCHQKYLSMYDDILSLIPFHNGKSWQAGVREISNSECNLYIEMARKKLKVMRKGDVASRSVAKSFCGRILPADGVSTDFRVFVFHCLNYFIRIVRPDLERDAYIMNSFIFNHETHINSPSLDIVNELNYVKTAEDFSNIIERERDQINRFWQNVMEDYMRIKHTVLPRLQT